MKRTWIILAIALLAIFAASGAWAVMAKDAPEKVTIDDCVAKKSAVEFPHKLHFETNKIECKTCHHQQEDLVAGAEIEVQPCGSCHVEPEKAETPKCSEMSTKKNPFHITCIGCHKDTVKADATKKAPTKCDQCHPKA